MLWLRANHMCPCEIASLPGVEGCHVLHIFSFLIVHVHCMHPWDRFTAGLTMTNTNTPTCFQASHCFDAWSCEDLGWFHWWKLSHGTASLRESSLRACCWPYKLSFASAMLSQCFENCFEKHFQGMQFRERATVNGKIRRSFFATGASNFVA